ncbi:hypothetical protein AB0N24_22830 [Arthrobacter sp. NPDC093128]|uniref:hypothetical protein n=1 Tax=Arthrobacter sp. NPDC093128 TaxID=3154979 RepID=UPI00341D6D5B
MMPKIAETWTGKVPSGKTAWAEVEPTIFRGDKDLSVSTTDAEQPRSPYSARFSQGATIVPRVLFMVEPTPASSLKSDHLRPDPFV